MAIQDDVSNLGSDARDKLTSDFSDLKSSFAKLRSDVVSLLNDSLGVGKAGGSALKDQAMHAADGLKSRAYDAVGGLKGRASDLQHRGEDAVEAVGDKISENPVAAALIALGVGFVVAKLLTSSRK